MSLAQLERRAMQLEGQYQRFLLYHKYIGNKSPVAKLHAELNEIWKEIRRRSLEARKTVPAI